MATQNELVQGCICATVRRKRRGHPRRFIFDTVLQEDVERVMAEIGYGCTQYCLSYVNVMSPDESS